MCLSLQRWAVLLRPACLTVRWRAPCSTGAPAWATAAWWDTNCPSPPSSRVSATAPGAVKFLCVCVSDVLNLFWTFLLCPSCSFPYSESERFFMYSVQREQKTLKAPFKWSIQLGHLISSLLKSYIQFTWERDWNVRLFFTDKLPLYHIAHISFVA